MIVSFPHAGDDDPFIVETTIGEAVKFSLRTADPAIARERDAIARAQLGKYFAAAGTKLSPLPHRQRVALSGLVYDLYVRTYESEPGSPSAWAAFKAFNRAACEGRCTDVPQIGVGEVGDPSEAFEKFGEDLTAGVNSFPPSDNVRGLESRFGPLADWVLAQQGLAISANDRIALLREIGRAATDAGWRLKRNSLGDYSPDPVANRFPAFEAGRSLTLSELWKRWQAAANPSPNTINSWRAPIESLKSFLGHEDVHRISESDIVRWKDYLLSLSLSHKTINDGYLSSLKAIFNQAVRDRLLAKNPLTDIRVAVRRRAGASMLPYSDEEVSRLIRLASRETDPAHRWLPLLAATTGARIGELAQLWGNQIVAIDGILAINIRPAEDGGSLKNESSERLVPLHPAVIDAGFLPFVESRGSGPLFYRRSSGDPSKRHASKGVTNRLAAWIRERGFHDPRKSPNHALRHWWKTAAARVGIQDSLADTVQGHASRSVASTYRHFDLKTLADAVAKIPLPGETTSQEEMHAA